jgi:hypothetical protein
VAKVFTDRSLAASIWSISFLVRWRCCRSIHG